MCVSRYLIGCMHGASIHFRSARLETAVGTRQRSAPTAILLSAASIRRPSREPRGNARKRKRGKRGTRFLVTGGLSCLTDRRDSETNDARLLDESHLGTAQRDGQLPK